MRMGVYFQLGCGLSSTSTILIVLTVALTAVALKFQGVKAISESH